MLSMMPNSKTKEWKKERRKMACVWDTRLENEIRDDEGYHFIISTFQHHQSELLEWIEVRRSKNRRKHRTISNKSQPPTNDDIRESSQIDAKETKRNKKGTKEPKDEEIANRNGCILHITLNSAIIRIATNYYYYFHVVRLCQVFSVFLDLNACHFNCVLYFTCWESFNIFY